MASGWTTTSSLTDSLNTIVAAAFLVREYEGVMPNLVDKETLPKGSGLSYIEVELAKLTAQAITETSKDENPQEISDTPMTVTPSMVSISVVLTDRMRERISAKALAKLGALAGNAIQRKKDIDGLTMLDGFSTFSQPGAGNVMTSGVVRACLAQIQNNATQGGKPPFRVVLHGYQVYALEAEFTAPVGTYPIGEGPTARVFAEGWRGNIASGQVFVDDNITVDSSSDAKGGAFTQDAILLVQGMALKKEQERKPNWGGGADVYYIRDEYAYGERKDYWGGELYSDATAPTS